jgi:lipopolysaccharide export system protein LptC
MFTLKNALVGFLLLLALSLSTWSLFKSYSKSIVVVKTDPTRPDSYMLNVTATIFNKEGLPALQVVTPKMVHYPENNTTNLDQPRVTIYRKSPQPWYIKADYAKASDGMKQIVFWSNVNIHHVADSENPDTSLETTSLTIFPEQQIASTGEAVTFLQPDTKIHAVGMLANLDAGTVKLLSQTKGEYDPVS